jgi:hypothetical protein
MKKIARKSGGAPARKPNAAPGFLTEVMLKKPFITAYDSWSLMEERTHAFVA